MAKKADFVLIGLATTALAIAELLFALGNAAYGILVALASITTLLLVISVVRIEAASARVVEVICLLLMYVLLISALPWFFIRQDLLIPGVYLILIALCAWHVRDSDLNLQDLGIRLFSPGQITAGCLIGGITGLVEFQILRPPPALPSFSFGYLLQTVLYMVAFVGFGEELLFRGILLTTLERVAGARPALIVHSLVFAILHFTWRSIPEVVFVFFTGLILGLVFQRTRSLSAPVALHAANNVFLVAVFPFL